MGFLKDLIGMGAPKSDATTVTLPKWIKSPTQDYLNRAVDLSNQTFSPYGGQTVAQFNPYQTQALEGIAQRAQQGNPLLGAAQSQLMSTINGEGFSNPYLTQQIDQASQDVLRNYNLAVKPQMEASMVRSGSFGNSGLQQMQREQQSDLQRNLLGISTTMRGNAYEAERNRQYGAIGQAPGLANADYNDLNQLYGAGQTYQGQNQANLDDAYSRWQQEQQHPYRQLEMLGGVINPLFSAMRGSTTSYNPSAQDRAANIVGSVAELGNSIFALSDERAKEDKERIGTTYEGTPIYKFRYRGDPEVRKGLLAQDVQERQPSAVRKGPQGLLMVDYSKVK